MRDEIEDRIWVEHGADITAFLDRVVHAVKVTFARLHDIEFEAPWRQATTPDRC